MVRQYRLMPLGQNGKKKTTFTARNKLWQWEVLSFGLTSVSTAINRLMKKVLTRLQQQTLPFYLDKMIVYFLILRVIESGMRRCAPTFDHYL